MNWILGVYLNTAILESRRLLWSLLHWKQETTNITEKERQQQWEFEGHWRQERKKKNTISEGLREWHHSVSTEVWVFYGCRDLLMWRLLPVKMVKEEERAEEGRQGDTWGMNLTGTKSNWWKLKFRKERRIFRKERWGKARRRNCPLYESLVGMRGGLPHGMDTTQLKVYR